MRVRRAFTLFEVLVALAFVVILMGTLASTLGIAWRSKRAAENAVETVRDIQTIGDILVEDLQGTLPPWVDTTGGAGTVSAAGSTDANGNPIGGIVGSPTGSTDANGESTYIEHLVGPFRGETSSVGFYTTGNDPKSLVQGGIRWVEYSLGSETGGDGFSILVRRVESNLLRSDWIVDDPVSSDLEDEVLMKHVIDLTFQYADESGTLWDTWYSEDHENTLPYSVVIELTLAPQGEGRENRIIRRTASIYTAAPPVITEDSTSSGGATGLQ
jgi:type II secretory pathway pseudopilin PulG